MLNRSLIQHGACALLLLSTGCDTGSDVDVTDTTTTRHSDLYQEYPLWPGGYVPVCFTPASTSVANFSTFQSTARQSIQNSWGRAARLQIYGFDTICGTSTNGMVTINLTTGMCSGGYINRTTHGGVGGGGYYSNQSTDICLKVPNDNFVTAVMHEMGHALGMGHEHERPDWSDTCWKQTFRAGTNFGTPADPQSIMEGSYCQENTVLSPWDIVGIQNAYGRKQAGALVATNNQCLDVPNNTFSLGQAMQVFDCNSNLGQSWRVNNDFTMNAPGKPPSYLDVRGSGGSGTPVQMFTKNTPTTSNQTWWLFSMQMIAIGDKCLDVPSANYYNGQIVQLHSCNGGGNQNWNIVPVSGSGPLAFHIADAVHNTYCISAPDNAGVGSLLTLQQCEGVDGNTKQQFTLKDTGEITYQGFCWDLQWNDVSDGRLLQLYSCKTPADPAVNNDKRNQLFHLRGPIYSNLGFYMTTPSSDPQKWDPVWVKTTPLTTWDYYFKQ